MKSLKYLSNIVGLMILVETQVQYGLVDGLRPTMTLRG